MQTARTTLRLPKNIYDELVEESLKKGISFNKVVIDKIRSREAAKRRKALGNIRMLTRGVKAKGINYRQLVEYGRKY